jgi:hypothetical protein
VGALWGASSLIIELVGRGWEVEGVFAGNTYILGGFHYNSYEPEHARATISPNHVKNGIGCSGGYFQTIGFFWSPFTSRTLQDSSGVAPDAKYNLEVLCTMAGEDR